MTTQTPTQIATESMKGCGAIQRGMNKKICDKPFECNCGNIIKETLILCPSCKSKVLAHKQDWEGELEFLNNYMHPTPFAWGKLKPINKPIEERISILTQALKILEGGK